MPPTAPGSLVPAFTPVTPAAPAALVAGPVPVITATATITLVTLTDDYWVNIGGDRQYTLAAADGPDDLYFADAAGLARNINGGKTGLPADPHVSATVAGNVVTLHARVPGRGGNTVSLATGPFADGTILQSGEHLTGGSGDPDAPSAALREYAATYPDAPGQALPDYTTAATGTIIAATAGTVGATLTVGAVTYTVANARGGGKILMRSTAPLFGVEIGSVLAGIDGFNDPNPAVLVFNEGSTETDLTAVIPGAPGNAVALAKGGTGGGACFTLSGAHLTGGTPPAVVAPSAAVPAFAPATPATPGQVLPGHTPATPTAPAAAVPAHTPATPAAPGQVVANG